MLPKRVQNCMIVYHSLENIDMKYIALFFVFFLVMSNFRSLVTHLTCKKFYYYCYLIIFTLKSPLLMAVVKTMKDNIEIWERFVGILTFWTLQKDLLILISNMIEEIVSFYLMPMLILNSGFRERMSYLTFPTISIMLILGKIHD